MRRQSALGKVISAVAVLATLAGCGEAGDPAGSEATDMNSAALAEALTFHASFDDGFDAAYARGDRRIYSAPSYSELEKRSPGYWGEEIAVAYDVGRVGHALEFKTKNTKALFYSAEDNAAFSAGGWSGAVSFWLSLDPETDLEPGFCDPIQITDKAYNDAAIWVDFTKETPRKFRLGVFGDLEAWNPENKGNDENPAFNQRLTVVEQPPFAKGEWTHVAIAYEDLGAPGGRATLYLNGQAQGTSENITEAFSWDMSTATIRLGVNYVGLYDELALFDRALTADEIARIYQLKGGIAELRD